VLEDCQKIVADDPNVGITVLATNLVHGRPYLKLSGAAIEQAAAATEKPAVVFGHLHSTISREEAARLRGLGIPVLMGTTTALAAMTHFLTWHRQRDRRDEEAGAAPAATVRTAETWRPRLEAATGALSPQDAERLLRDAGLPVVESVFAATSEDVLAAGARLGFPVVLKTASPEILHKTEMGGVKLGIGNGPALAAAYEDIAKCCGPLVQVQRMADSGTEIFLGMVNDAQFGPIATLGIGGIFAEVYKDTVAFVPPIGPQVAARLLRELQGFALLDGARGRGKADIPALARLVSNFSWLCAAIGPQLSEFDLNPIIAGPWGAVAVDALVVPRGAATAASQQKDLQS
jgi:acyl-CoA synthetase (NDP forming)